MQNFNIENINDSKYNAFIDIFLKVRKKISDFANCKSFNADAKHLIATVITNDICDELDKMEALQREEKAKCLIEMVDEAKANMVIETESLEGDDENLINEKTFYSKVFAYPDADGNTFTIITQEVIGGQFIAKPLAKIHKNGVIIYMDNQHKDPLVNETIEEILRNNI